MELEKTVERIVPKDFKNRYNTGLFYLDSQNVNLSMDLFAVAQK
jgi:hypothetical protein